MPQRIIPNLWFDTEAEEAADFYTSVFKNSRIVNVSRYTEAGPREAGMVMTVEFELDGQRFVGINGGPQFTFSEAVSFQINCQTQDDVDYYWERLSEGGEEGPCGWLKDRYGLSWQVVPTGMDELFSDPDPQRAERAMKAMLGMSKLDIASLRDAADGSRRPDSQATGRLTAASQEPLLQRDGHVPPLADRSAAFRVGQLLIRAIDEDAVDRDLVAR
jgi:predicted 3-demethylubiquinone-9 3-methyltransferase (glyoxalase superfamily)